MAGEGPLMATDPSQMQGQQQAPPAVSAMQQQLQQIAQTPMQPVPPVGPDQGSPVRRFLTNFFYGAGQGLLREAGLPTDYQKQQQTIANNQRQQQLNQQAGETASLIGLHQQQLKNEQQTYLQTQHENEEVPIGQSYGQLLGLDPNSTMRRKDIPAAILAGVKGSYQQKVADTRADASRDVATIKTGAQRDLEAGRTQLALARLSLQKQLGLGNLAARNASLQQRLQPMADPGAERLRRADLADNAQGNLDGIADDIKADPSLFGRVAGRYTDVQQMMGSDDPAIARIGMRIHNYALASNGAHGLRSAQAIPDTEHTLLNHFRNSPDATISAIGAARDSLNDFITDATLGKRPQVRHLQGNSGGGGNSPSPAPQATHRFNPATGQIEAIK